jgi:hypothetical protein
LRNTWLNFILDRYFHYLLFYSMFLPLDGAWAIDAKTNKNNNSKSTTTNATASKTFVTPATIALKLLVTWIYWDAGYGKYSDPLRGWTLDATPLPALDTYVRHTVAARYLYGLLGPAGLRYMTPTVVYAEMFGAPTALWGCYSGSKGVVYGTVALMCSIHVGIAFTMRNTVLLSSAACVAWCIFLPEGVGADIGLVSYESAAAAGAGIAVENGKRGKQQQLGSKSFVKRHGASALIIGIFVAGSVWFETMSAHCNQSMEHIWSTLLHNRWNVFVGAEEYVTWEIAPGRLLDGSIVDVWSKTDNVLWEMPGAGAPCTSTARAGRWRSFPYLAELSGEDGETLWRYLCQQWDEENGVDDDDNGNNQGRKLLRFNFFMLQADVLPNMGFSATRKRLIHSHDCLSDSNFVKEEDRKSGQGFNFESGEL